MASRPSEAPTNRKTFPTCRILRSESPACPAVDEARTPIWSTPSGRPPQEGDQRQAPAQAPTAEVLDLDQPDAHTQAVERCYRQLPPLRKDRSQATFVHAALQPAQAVAAGVADLCSEGGGA
eukprot:TRINITY_DN19425_c0_g1_i1.p1 TRINITY_DN19425_c0_g1~~TRINITY_DN19425_c0_g1_i1.p1  ORF type:complete len:122 (+),score=12.45 TRINITY_DN19425_c0_g1_i1:98-463(+)